MGSGIAQRPPRPAPVMTKELRARKRLSLVENLRVYPPIWMVGLGVAILALGIVVACLGNTALIVVASVLLIVGGFFGAAIGAGWWSEATAGSARSFKQRRFDVVADRARRSRRHWQDDLSRLRELEYAYPRYSVMATRDGTNIRVDVVKHTPVVWRWGIPPLLRWHATKTNKGYDASRGTWDQTAINGRIVTDPTIPNVQKALDDACKSAEALENNDYAECLKRHRLDALALTVSPPPASEETHVLVDAELKRNGKARVKRSGKAREAGL